MPSRPVRNSRTAALAVVASLALAPALAAAVADVQVGGAGLVFTPASVTVQAGDSVRFTNAGGTHNVTADDGSFRCANGCDGQGGDGAISGAPWSSTVAYPRAGTYLYHCEEHGGAGGVGMSGRVIVQPAPRTPCVAGPNTLCLGAGGRFQVEVSWVTGIRVGKGTAVPLPAAPQSGLFYFFDPSNVEMLVKVLDACVPALGNQFWVFYAATTNVQFTLTVIDTRTGQVQVYSNPPDHTAAPVQDTHAFSTCP
jgi:plastocyanin